ncbi:minor tail protein [Microbacterium phage Zeta1847]|uniref:Minor tail protein n=1 Tax=Microbacterium phage Zeta1847 TaxID=2201444 RepID=A0A2Z4Q9C1_9CAUD|nr:minor tail protein [Microbacterium phage Zeta1847]AWY06651.1 minor tail protein [Microbacterium phage Zeta1847]
MADYAYPKALTGLQDVQWSNMMSAYIEDGVTTPGAFAPSADGSGMAVKLAPGEAIVRAVLTGDADTATVAIDAAPAAGTARIDTIVKRLNRSSTPVIQTAVVKGNPSANPTRPTLTQNASGVWEWPVCDVRVDGGATSIQSGKITDRRSHTGQNVGRWTTDTRPGNPRPYVTLGYNTTRAAWEYHDGTTWRDLVEQGVVPVSKGGTGATGISLQLLANLGIVVSATQPAAGTAILWAKRSA